MLCFYCRPRKKIYGCLVVKFLYDSNLSHKLVKILEDIFPDSTHPIFFSSQSASDLEIWNYAKEYSYTIVTKDEDYHNLVTLKGHPPKVIWIRIGNTSNQIIESILRKNLNTIHIFHDNPEMSELLLW